MANVNLMNGLDTLVEFCTQHVVPSVQANPLPLLIVALFIAANLGLYAFTKGQEFLITGYSAVLFLLPFIRLG